HLGLGGVLAQALLGEGLLLAAVLLAQPLQPAAQGGEHGLLALQGGAAPGQLGAVRLPLALLPGRLLLALLPARVPAGELAGVLLQLARGPLEGLEAAVHLQGVALELLLALLQGGGQPIQAHQVGLVLGLALAQGLALLLVFLVTLGPVRLAAGGLRLHLLLALAQEPLLLFQRPAPGRQLGGQGVQLLAALLAAQLLGPGQLGVELALLLLDAAGGAADGLLEAGQAVAALAVALVELLADGGHLAAEAVDLLLLAADFFAAL